MSANSQLTIAVHVLAWMAAVERHSPDLVTSEQIAASVNTNPVVIRRTLGKLRQAKLVSVQRGAGAGWRLARPPASITLLEVYEAVETSPIFGLHHNRPSQICPIGRGLPPVLKQVYGDVERTVRHELAQRTIADVLADALSENAGLPLMIPSTASASAPEPASPPMPASANDTGRVT